MVPPLVAPPAQGAGDLKKTIVFPNFFQELQIISRITEVQFELDFSHKLIQAVTEKHSGHSDKVANLRESTFAI